MLYYKGKTDIINPINGEILLLEGEQTSDERIKRLIREVGIDMKNRNQVYPTRYRAMNLVWWVLTDETLEHLD